MGTSRYTRLTRPGAVKRLLIRATNWLGDAVLTVPAVSALRTAFPETRITLLAKAPVAELFQHHPAVDEILLYRDPGVHHGMSGKWMLARTLRRGRFDLAVLLQNAFEAALIAVLAGIPNRYGYPTDGRWMLLSHPVSPPPGLREKHQVEYYLELLRPLGIPVTPTAPVLFTTMVEDQAAADHLRGLGITARSIIGLNPGSTYGTAKRWLPERYAAVADRLAIEYRAHVLIFGGRGEEALGAGISAMMKAPNTVLSGKTTVRQLMAFLKRCTVFITNDAGPMHIAQALGVPVVAVFGPTDPRTTSPFGTSHELVRQPVECSPCLLRECPIDHRCMQRILPDMVYAAAVRRLQRAAVSPAAPAFLMTNERGTGDSVERAPKRSLVREGQSLRDSRAPVVFLDRDGTLNWDPGYLNDPNAMKLLPGVSGALARLNRAGYKTVVVSNQSGVGRGLIRLETLDAIHARLRELLAEAGAWLDAIYACIHHPDEGCECRKPAIGLVVRARQELALSNERAFVVGDRAIDIALARNIGALGVFVLSGYRPHEEQAQMAARGLSPDFTAKDLEAAVGWILQQPAPIPEENACPAHERET